MSPCIFSHTCRVLTGQQTSHKLSPVASGVSGLSRTQLPLQKKNQPFLPLGNTKTGHSSITITLIKRETKDQHSSSSRIRTGLNQSFSHTPQLSLLDSISKRQLALKQGSFLGEFRSFKHGQKTLFRYDLGKKKSQVNVNKNKRCSLWASASFMFLQRREKPLMQLPQKSRCQQFGAVPSVPVFCFSCLSSPSRLMLHFAFPRCIRWVKEWSEHICGNPLFAWWTYLFTPGSSHLEVITAPLSQPLITGFVVQSRSFKSSQLERLY